MIATLLESIDHSQGLESTRQTQSTDPHFTQTERTVSVETETKQMPRGRHNEIGVLAHFLTPLCANDARGVFSTIRAYRCMFNRLY